MPRRLDQRTVDEIVKLYKSGNSINYISKVLNIYRGSVRLYLNGGYATPPPLQTKISSIHDLTTNQVLAYSYILGCYLGDGSVQKFPTTYRFQLSCDIKHIEVVNRQVACLKVLLPLNKVRTFQIKNASRTNGLVNCIRIEVYNSSLVVLFPQHGVGKKYQRDVSLNQQQMSIINYKLCLAGLIDTDGSVFYFNANNSKKLGIEFTNKSAHILDLYCHLLDSFDIRYRRRNKYKTNDSMQVVAVRDQIEAKKLLLLLDDAYATIASLS